MANFTATQSITSTGLCANLVSTDTSDYTSNNEGYTLADVQYKTWTFRNSTGTIIKQETVSGTTISSSCPITLLTFGTQVELYIYIYKSGSQQGYSVQNNLTISCLGI